MLNIVPFRGWSERHHMMETGAFVFSYWLGIQYGAAVQQDTILAGPPLETVAGPPLVSFYESPVGLSGEHLEHYLRYKEATDFLPANARVFNPRTDPDYPDYLAINAGVYGQGYLPLQSPEAEDFYSMLLSFEYMVYEADLDADEQEAISAWRMDNLPGHLLDAGIDYLIFSDSWFGWLSPEAAAILTDPANYERIGEWYNNTSAETYSLYRVVTP